MLDRPSLHRPVARGGKGGAIERRSLQLIELLLEVSNRLAQSNNLDEALREEVSFHSLLIVELNDSIAKNVGLSI